MSMIVNPYWFGGSGPPPTSGFWNAIAAISPQIWLRLNEASGSTAVNSGSEADGSYNGGIDYQQGALVDGEPSANSIATSGGGDYVRVTTAGGSANLIGVCYAGTGGGNSTARILWRTVMSNTGGAYLRIDTTNITIQLNNGSGAINTGVASSVLKDGDPHLILLGRLSEDPTDVHLWIDGALVWTYEIGAGTLDYFGDLLVGRNGSTAQYCYGRYADAFLKQGSVSAAEVAAINSAWAP